MQKVLIKLMVFSLILSLLPSHIANATTVKEQTEVINKTELLEVLPQNIEEIEINGDEKENSININVDLLEKDKEIKSEIVFYNDLVEDNYVNIESISENGEIINKNYHLNIIDITEDSYKVKLIDVDTSEEFVIDSTQLQATAIPVLVGLIVRAGLNYVVKHYGKKIAMQAMIEVGVSQITKAYGGEVKKAKNGKGKVITIPNKKQPIVIRLMEEGSGGRKEAYWRMSVGNKAVNRAGNYSNNANETHITLQESSIGTIINLIKKYKK